MCLCLLSVHADNFAVYIWEIMLIFMHLLGSQFYMYTLYECILCLVLKMQSIVLCFLRTFFFSICKVELPKIVILIFDNH